jgi:spoIIIJ-associated protein
VSSEEAGSGLEVEASGETVGEAKWSALRELERRFPGLDKASVRFAVLSEGERGLLGVGHVPARVLASLTTAPPLSMRIEAPVATEEPGSPPARLREFLDRICLALGTPASIEIYEDEESLTAALAGPGLGLVIGKRGQTIDAIQYLANAVVWRGAEDRKPVVVDASGYRSRRQASLERQAERAAEKATATGKPAALEPMTAVERKIVHLYLQDRPGIETESEGTEPSRYVVVRPAGGE